MTTHHVPAGHNSVSPYLIVDDAPALLEFLGRVLGAVEIARHAMPDGAIMHAEVRVGDSVIMVGQAPTRDAKPTVHVYLPDVDAAHARALAAGATSTRPPTDMPFGDRMGMVVDKFGITWALSTHVADAPK